MASEGFDFLTERAGETDEEKRLREAMCRHAEGLMHALDSSVRLRTAGDQTKRMRSMARSSLQDACLRGMEAFSASRK